jgi:hypothetical protein
VVIKKSFLLRKDLFGLLSLCVLLSFAISCHNRNDSGILVPEGKIVFDRIAVVPFQQIAPESSASGVVRCPLCGLIFSASTSTGTPEKISERLFLERVQERRPRFAIIEGDRVAGAYRRISSDSVTISLRKALRDVGNELGAEAIVVGYVYRFRERKGNSYTVEQPASVAFDIHLLRVSDGELVWRGAFDRTQTSLMEDLMQITSFFREKGRWVTAEELAEEGIQEILKTFPGLM